MSQPWRHIPELITGFHMLEHILTKVSHIVLLHVSF